MKIKRRITAFLAAAVMAASCMGVNTGATSYTWNLSSSGTTSIHRKHTASSNGFAGITEKCGSYNSSTASNGNVAYVRYWTYATKSDGTTVIIGLGSGSYYHYSTQSTHKIPFNQKITKGQILHVRYELENSSITSSMSGLYTTYY